MQPDITMPRPTTVKTYKALLSQGGTNAPVPTILLNTIGTITWTRDDVGYYIATKTGAFPQGKTEIITTNTGDGARAYNQFTAGINLNPDSIFLESASFNGVDGWDDADDTLLGTPIEINVYT